MFFAHTVRVAGENARKLPGTPLSIMLIAAIAIWLLLLLLAVSLCRASASADAKESVSRGRGRRPSPIITAASRRSGATPRARGIVGGIGLRTETRSTRHG